MTSPATAQKLLTAVVMNRVSSPNRMRSAMSRASAPPKPDPYSWISLPMQ